MTKQTYHNQTLTQYLLGSLPDGETEHLDELSFTDDEFADALRVAEKDLVDAYVQGELTGADLEQFKSSYLASPLRREKVKFERAFQDFVEKHVVVKAHAEAQTESSSQAAAKRKKTGWFSALSIFSTPRPALQWGLAVASLILLIGGAWLLFENARLRQQLSQIQARRDGTNEREQGLQQELEEQRSLKSQTEQELTRVREERAQLEQQLKKEQEQQRLAEQRAAQQQPSPGGISVASFILLPQMRGAEQVKTVSIPDETAYVAMQLRLEPNDYPAYRVVLLNPSNNQTLWRSGKLKARAAGESKSLGISFSADLLQPQTYLLRVYGIAADGASEIISEYPFKVVR